MEQDRPEDMAETMVGSLGPIGRLLTSIGVPKGSAVAGTTNPFTGNVKLNQGLLDQYSPEQAQDVLAHELTHSQQVKDKSYLQRILTLFDHEADEKEAYQVSENRAMKRRDIPLKSESR